jgi:hypothetical protein
MASSSEEAEVLEAAVAGIPKIAQIIAFMPVEDRASALDAAERSYLQTARDLGGAENLAQNWASAVKFHLQAAVGEQVLANSRLLNALHKELIGESVEAEHVEKDIEELVHKTYGHDTQRDSLSNEAASGAETDEQNTGGR